jgi:O-acetylhomoserine/O-acetylserine sulfhydrylase-like pyridoxal-dependent enzyme
MAALTAATRLVHSGQRILAGDDIYGGTSRLLSAVLPKQGARHTHRAHRARPRARSRDAAAD